MNYCPDCGEELVSDSAFCHRCGSEVPDGSPRERPVSGSESSGRSVGDAAPNPRTPSRGEAAVRRSRRSSTARPAGGEEGSGSAGVKAGHGISLWGPDGFLSESDQVTWFPMAVGGVIELFGLFLLPGIGILLAPVIGAAVSSHLAGGTRADALAVFHRNVGSHLAVWLLLSVLAGLIALAFTDVATAVLIALVATFLLGVLNLIFVVGHYVGCRIVAETGGE